MLPCPYYSILCLIMWFEFSKINRVKSKLLLQNSFLKLQQCQKSKINRKTVEKNYRKAQVLIVEHLKLSTQDEDAQKIFNLWKKWDSSLNSGAWVIFLPTFRAAKIWIMKSPDDLKRP